MTLAGLRMAKKRWIPSAVITWCKKHLINLFFDLYRFPFNNARSLFGFYHFPTARPRENEWGKHSQWVQIFGSWEAVRPRMTQKLARMMSFSPRIFKSCKVGNDIYFIMTFFQIPVRKTSGKNSHWNEENTVKMIQTSVMSRSTHPIVHLYAPRLWCPCAHSTSEAITFQALYFCAPQCCQV